MIFGNTHLSSNILGELMRDFFFPQNFGDFAEPKLQRVRVLVTSYK